MSYDFTGVTGKFLGDFGLAQTAPPIFIACRIKYANHPVAFRNAVTLHAAPDSSNSSFRIRTSATDGVLSFAIVDSVGASGDVGSTTGDASEFDNAWLPIMGSLPVSTTRNFYWGGTPSSGTSSPGAVTFDNPRYIAIGGLYHVTSDAASYKVAEVIVGFTEPTAQQRTDWAAGVDPLEIWNGFSDWHYYPLNVDSSTQTDASGNGGPTLTLSGTATYDGADHPTITTSANPVLSLQPLYYGASPLANKTNLQWLVTAGHTNLTGTWLGSGVAGTTDASGNFTPNGDPNLGAVNDEVTLHLYWEEGTNPIVDRSLIVKTTLVAA